MADLAVDAQGDVVGLGNVLDNGQAQAGTHGVVLGAFAIGGQTTREIPTAEPTWRLEVILGQRWG